MRRILVSVAVMAIAAHANADDITVHVTGDAHARFQLKTPDGWTTLCTVPCTVRAPWDGVYRITSDVALDSRPVGLPSGDNVTLEAHLTTFGERQTGGGLMIFGGVMLIGGGVTIASAFFWALDLAISNLCLRLFANQQCPTYDSSGPAILAVVGVGIAAVGGGLFGAGASLHRPSRLVPVLPEQRNAPDTPRYDGYRPPTWQFPVVTYRW